MKSTDDKTAVCDSPAVQKHRHRAVTALVTALAAGVVETAAHLWPFDDLTDDAGAVIVRLLIYAVVAAVILRFAHGREWARLVLIVGLGAVGTASLLLEPVMWLFDDPDIGGFFGGLDGPGTVILLSRIVHLAAVGIGVIVMLGMSPHRQPDGDPAE